MGYANIDDLKLMTLIWCLGFCSIKTQLYLAIQSDFNNIFTEHGTSLEVMQEVER